LIPSISLHSAEKGYKRSIYDLQYLEDALNDSSFHFGAAIERFLIVNEKLSDYLRKCESALAKLEPKTSDYYDLRCLIDHKMWYWCFWVGSFGDKELESKFAFSKLGNFMV